MIPQRSYEAHQAKLGHQERGVARALRNAVVQAAQELEGPPALLDFALPLLEARKCMSALLLGATGVDDAPVVKKEGAGSVQSRVSPHRRSISPNLSSSPSP